MVGKTHKALLAEGMFARCASEAVLFPLAACAQPLDHTDAAAAVAFGVRELLSVAVAAGAVEQTMQMHEHQLLLAGFSWHMLFRSAAHVHQLQS
jgi:hypothetical protein